MDANGRLVEQFILCVAGCPALPCNDVSDTYIDHVTHVQHPCRSLCPSYIKRCKAQCPDYARCMEGDQPGDFRERTPVPASCPPVSTSSPEQHGCATPVVVASILSCLVGVALAMAVYRLWHEKWKVPITPSSPTNQNEVIPQDEGQAQRAVRFRRQPDDTVYFDDGA